MSAQQAEHGMIPTFDCIYYLNLKDLYYLQKPKDKPNPQ